MINWQDLQSETQLDSIREKSFDKPQLIFKHSISCGISAYIQDRLDSATTSLGEQFDLHYLDLITYRPVSNKIASDFGVPHQSPQVILIKDGQAIHNASHHSIVPERILAAV
ncbi:MAG: bacillithiol system redox-active protein YtxJ [Bacteroidota bacterium]